MLTKNFHVITNQIPMIKDQIDKMRLNHCNLHAAIYYLNFVSVDQAHIPLGGRLEFFIKQLGKGFFRTKHSESSKRIQDRFCTRTILKFRTKRNQIISKGNICNQIAV